MEILKKSYSRNQDTPLIRTLFGAQGVRIRGIPLQYLWWFYFHGWRFSYQKQQIKSPPRNFLILLSDVSCVLLPCLSILLHLLQNSIVLTLLRRRLLMVQLDCLCCTEQASPFQLGLSPIHPSNEVIISIHPSNEVSLRGWSAPSRNHDRVHPPL